MAATLSVVLKRKAVNHTLFIGVSILVFWIGSLVLLLLDWQDVRRDDLFDLLVYGGLTLWVFWFLGVWIFRLLRFRKCPAFILRFSEKGVVNYAVNSTLVKPWHEYKHVRWINDMVSTRVMLIPARPTLRYKIMTFLGTRPDVFPEQYVWLGLEDFVLFMDRHAPDKYVVKP